REPLGITGEVLFRVGPLSVDDAVSLFVERAGAAAPPANQPDPSDPRDRRILEGICRRLDGLPLAIELAAARLRTVPFATLAAEIEDRFGPLVRGARTAVPRQQTLRATVDWSYDRLSDAERTVFERLSAFTNGCTLDAALAVCAVGSLTAADVREV